MLEISEGDPDDELLCVAVVKDGNKVVTGCTTGVLDVFSWKDVRDVSDRWPGVLHSQQRCTCVCCYANMHTGHPDQVDAVVAFDDDTIITGCNDGMIRVLALQPNRFLHVLGSHPGGLGVEALALGPGRRLLASVSQDEHAYVWSLDALFDSSDEEVGGVARRDVQYAPAPAQGGGQRRAQAAMSSRKRGRHRIRATGGKQGGDDFFADLL